jgi:hypothetical protein
MRIDNNGSKISSDDNSLFSLKDIFNCKALCVVTQEVDGKMVEGWTC